MIVLGQDGWGRLVESRVDNMSVVLIVLDALPAELLAMFVVGFAKVPWRQPPILSIEQNVGVRTKIV